MYNWTWVLAALAAASAKEEEPIVTDRPDFTESAIVVPLHRIQIESGATSSRSRGERSTSGPEALIRVGVASDWELRFGLPDYSDSRLDGERWRGWGDASVGFKRQFGPLASGLDAAVIGAVSIPTGESPFRAQEAEPEVRFCISKELNDREALSGMLARFWPAEGPDAWQATLSFGRALNEQWGFFLEWAADGANGERVQNTWHAGFTFRRTANEQWDVHFGFSPDGDRRRFLAAGYSIRR